MKKALSLILVLVMLLGMMPMQVFATEGTQETEAVEVVTEPTEAPEEETTAPTEETEPSGEEEEEVPSEPSESEEEPEVIHEHDYEAVVTDPTCSEQGYTTYSCICGDSYVSDYVDATDHTYKNGICTVCGEEDYDGLDLNGLNVLCLGDSITAGQGLTTETRWTNVLASKYGWNLTNKSQGGISLSSYYYTANGKSDVSIAKKAEILKTMTTKPDVIIVWGGHNDTSYRYSPLGTWDDETTDSFKGALKYIAELADEYAPDATLFVLTPLWTTEAPSTLKVPENTTDNNWMFVDAIYEGAEAYGWIPVNMDLCGITPFTKSGLLLDNIHPNEAGTEKIVAYLSAELASYSETSKKETIIFNASAVSMKPDESTTLKAVLSPRSGTGTMTFTWSSSDSSVATVDTSGKITAVAPGTAVITATAPNGISADISVSVVCEHTYEPSVTAPTCTEQGYTTYTCACGDSYVDDYIDGVWQLYDLAEHLVELPEYVCCDTNLWALLPHEDVHFTSGKRWGTNQTRVTSITIPLNAGDCVYATSWNKAGENGHETLDGIRLTFFDAYGIAQTLGPGESYKKFAANGGYLVAPEGTIAINIAMWYDSEEYEVFILNKEHIYEQIAVSPTCTEQGYSGTICLGCGDGERIDYVDALGHETEQYDAKPATCTESGWNAYETCSRCDYSTYVEIHALGHNYGAWTQVAAPACDAEGRDQSVCSICGETVYRDTRISGDPDKILVSNPVPENYYEGKTFLAIGDSLTAGTGVGTNERYHALMAQAFNGTNISGGTSGATLCPGGHLPNKFDSLMTKNYLTKNKVDVVTIFLGINDWDNGVVNGTYQGKLKYDELLTYYDLGEFGTDDTTTIYGAAKMWCERILELKKTAGCENIQFVFATPVITSWNKSLTMAKDWSQDKVNVFGYTLREYCAAIMEVCAYYEIPVLDLNMYSGMYYHSESDNNVAHFGGDGIHPGVNGHQMMADAFIEFLLEGYSYENRTVANCGHSYVKGICENCHLPKPGPIITQQPVDGEAKLGERYMVEVQAEGEGLKYQWYFRNAGSSTWYKSSVKDNTYDDVMTAARAGRVTYCVITDALGNTVKTDTVKLVCLPSEKLEITRQPTDGEAVLGERYCVTVEAKGESLKYQWYFRNKGAKSWTKSSVTDNTYDDMMTTTRDGREVYCVITDLAGNKVTTDTVKLVRVPMKLEIVSQPTDASAPFNQMFCATVAAKGEGLKYQWYYRNAGGLFWYKSSVRDNTYDDIMTKARNGREVYCVITDKYGNSVTTDIAKLIAVPEVELKLLSLSYEGAAMGERFCVSVEAEGDGLKYQWYFRNAGATRWSKSGVRDNTYDDVMNKTRANRQVYCVITDAFGNQVTTETVTLVLSK